MKLAGFFILLFLCYSNFVNADSLLRFRNIGFKEGLNNMNVSAITQDKLGYIWVATMGGVSRYNGHEFRRFYFDSSNSASLSSNHVSSIICASNGQIYIGTAIGLDSYDPTMDEIQKPFPELRTTILKIVEYKGFIYLGTGMGLFRFDQEEKQLEKIGGETLNNQIINDLFFDKSENLWCALDNERGLAMYDQMNDRLDVYPYSKKNKNSNYNTIRTIYGVNENTLLLGTKGGICGFDIATRSFCDNAMFSLLESTLEGSDTRFIFEKEPSVYWIGTLQNGLFIYDKTREKIVRHCQNDGLSEIHSNNITTYYTDKSGNIWLGTFDAGIDVLFKQAHNFNFDFQLNNLTTDKFITSIATDLNNNLVLATREEGFLVYNKKTKKSKLFNTENSGLRYDNLRTIFVDSENKYWLGVYYALQIFDPAKGTFRSIEIPEPNNGAVSFEQIGDRVFVGTDGQGLLIFDLQGNLQKQILNHGRNIPMIIQLNEDELFFCSYGNGLYTINTTTLSTRRIELADVKKYPGLLFAMNAYKDNEGIVWVGTYNYGMFAFNITKSIVRNITIKDGLPSTDAIGFEEDDESNLWVSTSYGLVKLNKNDFGIKTYSNNEGVNNYQFHGNASFKDENGIIYFGGNVGLTYFNPSEIIVEQSDPPHIVFENLYVQNSLVRPSDENSILSASLPFTKEIELTYKHQIFSVDFVSFDYFSPGKVQYYYMLEGFDKDWYNAGTQRRISYSNLPRGKYLLKVKSTNHAGVISDNEASFLIQVRPAPWFSYTAWFIYFVIVGTIFYLFFRLRIKAFVYKKNLEIEHSEHLRNREVNVMKQKFFTNISHELRTPLTLIYGLVAQLSSQEKLSPKVQEYAQSLDVNVSRLLRLINQLLAYKKMEGETLSLWLEKGNLNEAIQKILELFKVFVKEKEIRIDFIEDNIPDFWFDYDKLEKIMSNLISNAIKHSPNGNNIEVSARKIDSALAELLYKQKLNGGSSEYVEICVTDHGSGIDEKDWDTIFDRYKQIETNGKQLPDYSGTGIGLNFTKSLVELHHGKIRLESQIEKGTSFSFILPVDKLVYEEKDFSTPAPVVSDNSIIEDGSEKFTDEKTIKDIGVIEESNQTVLVVEDDPQLNRFLVNTFNPKYKTISATDGEAGLKMVKQHLPDVIVSDVMMPKKNGYELTKALKESREFCHIPVILLTAKTEISSQIEGMQSGADLYIPKPFDVNFLLAAIDSQLKNRKRIHEIFMNGQMPKLENSEINQLDIQFLSKLNAFLEKELSNPQLDIQLLAQNMNLSRSAFYRKFMSLTKLSPINYIKKYRINKSIELIKSGRYSLTEIGEMTGFGSPSYFSTAFKQEKGMAPRDYIAQLKNPE